MKAEALGRKVIRGIHGILNIAMLTSILLLLAFAGYALWDSHQVYRAAGKSQYAIYKPSTGDEGLSFRELQAINAEVFAWLTVYGTNIDYPVTQGPDNQKYVNTNAEGLYSLSGAIFLDCRSSPHFTDFSNILYGHHMEKKTMFGEVAGFADKAMFDSHRYGNLYYDGKDHGIEFFAFVHTHAYDGKVFTLTPTKDKQIAYLDNLLATAIHARDIGVRIEDNIILLSTCSSASTNGRDLLIGRITDEVYENPFAATGTNDGSKAAETGDRHDAIKISMLFLLLPGPILILALRALVKSIKHHRGEQKRRWWVT
ncbi:MAG: class B sortase [Clostridiales bacterium]|nr:class B sortase [Clostridiales bacterium]